jgi:simple sugar transport system permease protein
MRKYLGGIAAPLLGVVIAIILGMIITFVAGDNPFTAFGALFTGAFGGVVNSANTVAGAIPLLLTGLGVAIGFKAGLFNIGAEGQYWVGCMVAAWVGYSVHGLPPVLHITLAIVLAMFAAGLWGGVIPGLAKALVGAHEVITTMMLSYIAILLSQYMLENGPMMQRSVSSVGGYTPESPVILASAVLPKILPTTDLSWGLVIALVAVCVVYWMLFKTTLGFRLRAVGSNPRAAKYAGIDVSLHIVLALFISGAMAGLAGAIQILGVQHRLYDNFSSGYGYTAIVVALLANNNPFGIILSAIFFSALATGGQVMQLASGVPSQLTDVISGIIIFLVATKGFLQILGKRVIKRTFSLKIVSKLFQA